jgi:hypothetical protein
MQLAFERDLPSNRAMCAAHALQLKVFGLRRQTRGERETYPNTGALRSAEGVAGGQLHP